MSKHKKVKARKLYVPFLPTRTWEAPGLSIVPAEGYRKPVFVLPADAASYDAMVEQGATAIYLSDHNECLWGARTSWTRAPAYYQQGCRRRAEAALKANGITRPNETKA